MESGGIHQDMNKADASLITAKYNLHGVQSQPEEENKLKEYFSEWLAPQVRAYKEAVANTQLVLFKSEDFHKIRFNIDKTILQGSLSFLPVLNSNLIVNSKNATPNKRFSVGKMWNSSILIYLRLDRGIEIVFQKMLVEKVVKILCKTGFYPAAKLRDVFKLATVNLMSNQFKKTLQGINNGIKVQNY